MTRKELLNKVRENPELVATINSTEGLNFTNVKSSILEHYLTEWKRCCQKAQPVVVVVNKSTDISKVVLESVILSFLVALDERGLLDDMLAKIKG